jgi:hypothetical protein
MNQIGEGIARIASVAILLAALAAPAAAGGPLPADTFAGLTDYAHMWWAYGLRDERQVFRIQTSRYAMSFDYGRLRLTHLLPLAAAASEAEAVTQADESIFGTPNVMLDCVLEADGRRYALTAPARGDWQNCQFIESGRFFQRRYLERLSWQAGAPPAESGLEVAAWPDRLMLLLRTKPAQAVGNAALHLVLSFNDPAMGRLHGGRAFALEGPADSGVVLLTSDPARTGQGANRTTFAFSLPKEDWAAGVEKELAVIVYPAGKGLQARLATVLEDEQTPPVVVARQVAPTEADLNVTYDRRMGWHQVCLRNDVADDSPDGRNRRIERVRLRIENPLDRPRAVRLCFAKDRPLGIVGISAMLRDDDGNPTGIPVQVSKNWHTGRAPGRYQGPWYRGLTMLTVPPKATLCLEYTSANVLWGRVPAASHAQLCLAGWGSNQLWDESAIGAWGETICYEPDQGQLGGAVLDTRPLMVWSMGKDPHVKWGWTHNVGGADFLVYYDPAGVKQWNSAMRTFRRRVGPVLTEVTYAGHSHDAKIDLQYTVGIYRTDDIVRGVYRFRYDVRRATQFSRLVLFQCGGDDYSYTGERKFARGNEDGLAAEWDTTWGGNTYRTKPVELTGRVPWLSMHQAVRRENDQGAWANRGVVIRQWDAKLGGRPARPWVAERGASVRGTDTSLMDILPPPEVKALQAGDYVEAVVEHIVMPQHAEDYYGPNANLRAALQAGQDTWRMIHREAVGNDLQVQAARGQCLRLRPTMILAQANQAEFTIAGGLGYVPVTIAGLSGYRGPVLELHEAGGDWKAVDQADWGKDFWQTDYDAAAGTWQVTYSVPLDSPDDKRVTRGFRFRLDEAKH